jgi:hypothetical protein
LKPSEDDVLDKYKFAAVDLEAKGKGQKEHRVGRVCVSNSPSSPRSDFSCSASSFVNGLAYPSSPLAHISTSGLPSASFARSTVLSASASTLSTSKSSAIFSPIPSAAFPPSAASAASAASTSGISKSAIWANISPNS